MRSLPPLTALRAFEAAARHLSFKAAADELGLTPTAISHQIHLLERVAGHALFRRRPRPLALTSAGAALLPGVRSSFDTIAEVFAAVRNAAASRRPEDANAGYHDGAAASLFDITDPRLKSISGQLAARPPRLSLVVLPFADIGGAHGQEYFSDGITESLTTDLSRISGAFVIGHNTAFVYKGSAIDLRQIGRDLNVRYALQGSVQRAGNRLRVNVQLIDCDPATHLWAERFDQTVAGLFEMQDEIVARLASQ